MYVLCCRKRTLPGGASAREQRILVGGVLFQHGVHQLAHIVADARVLPDSRCIINRDTHVNVNPCRGYPGGQLNLRPPSR